MKTVYIPFKVTQDEIEEIIHHSFTIGTNGLEDYVTEAAKRIYEKLKPVEEEDNKLIASQKAEIERLEAKNMFEVDVLSKEIEMLKKEMNGCCELLHNVNGDIPIQVYAKIRRALK